MRRSRLHRALPALLLTAAALTACGDDATSDGSDRKPADATSESPLVNPRIAAFAVLDSSRAELAVLTQANLGSAFEPDGQSGVPDPEDPSASATGCDADVAFEERFDSEGFSIADAEASYVLIDDARLMVVTSAVASFGDETTAEAAFDALYDDIGECTHFEAESEDGLETTVLDVEVGTDAATDDVDGQFDMVGGGTWTFQDQEIPLGVGFSIARVDENVTMVNMISIGVTEDSELLEPYTEIAAGRLAAVAAGETPEDVAAPSPVTIPPSRVTPLPTEPRTLENFFASAPGIVGGG